jgi:hypothetical protein
MSDNVNISDKVEAETIRGEKSWQFIYIALGFAISIEGTLIQMISPPLTFPSSIILYGAVASVTFYLCICNYRFQNRILRMKRAYEDRSR